MSRKPRNPTPRFQLTPVTNYIKEIREEQDISQYTLAFHLGISRQALQAIETDKCIPNLLTAFRIARYFKKNIEEIFICDLIEEDFEVYFLNKQNSLHSPQPPSAAPSQKPQKRV